MFRGTLALVFAIAFTALAPSNAHATLNCDRTGEASALHYGSKVEGQNVRVCAEYWLQFAPVPVKPAAKKSNPVPWKPLPTSLVVKPAVPRIIRKEFGPAQFGQLLHFDTSALTHSRQGYLMGYRTEIRFRPIAITWTVSDGTVLTSAALEHAFANPGLYRVRASVRYAVKFRFIGGTDWIREPRRIDLKASPVLVRVVSSPVHSKRPVLVYRSCREAPLALGC
jgi:hypothetical protein